MSDKEKLEDEAPEIVTEETVDSADVEGHAILKGPGVAVRGGEAVLRGGDTLVR
jgi:hypothetical protein